MTARTIRNTEDDDLFERSLGLLERVFGESRSYHRDVRELDPLVERRDSLVAVVDGRVVGHLQVLPREMRVGRAILRVAGLACLAVDPAERGKGHERALIEAALRQVMRGGYHLAMVFAADDAPYGEFGWETLPVDTYVARLDWAGQVGTAPPGVRRMDPENDLAWVAAVHGGYGSSCSGPLVRSLGWWSGNMKWMRENPESSFVLERSGRIVGYARARHPVTEHGIGVGDFYSISDLAAQDEDSEKALLATMVQDARSRGFRHLAGQAPVARRAVALLEAIGTTARVKSDTRLKVKLVDLKSLLEGLWPEFSAALWQSSSGGSESVGIRVGRQSAELGYRDRAVYVGEAGTPSIDVSEAELWALVLKGAAPRGAPGKEAGVLKTLFRERGFAFWRADVF
ncbi:MAG: GNAT family N-acetyltransferase [Chloroflexi bacterium]|nr:GNAT family N-acetyltransferase [Chloroflexota bacterium]MCY3938881.1 GNAT family N-acetyltransferase [Chloroflexota bacterium]